MTLSSFSKTLKLLLIAAIAGGCCICILKVRSADRNMRLHLAQEARLAANAVSWRRVDALTGTAGDVGSPDYQRLKEQLTLIRSTDPRFRFVYLVGKKNDGSIFFMVDSEPPSSKDYSPPGEQYRDAPPALHKAFSHNLAATEGPYSDKWGRWTSSFVPINTPTTAAYRTVLAIDVNASDWNRALFQSMIEPILLTLLIIGILIKLNSMHRRFRLIFDHVPDAYLLLKDGVIIDCNRAAEVMLRGSRSQLIGSTPEQLSPELQIDGRKSSESATEMIDRALQSDTNSFEWTHRRLDGTEFHTEISLSNISIKSHRFLFACLRDTTQRKIAEKQLQSLNDVLLDKNEELQRNEKLLHEQNDALQATEEMLRVQIIEYETSQRLLKESETRFRALNEASFGGIAIHDNGVILECNRALATMTGFGMEELIGMNGLELIAPEWVETVQNNITSGFDGQYEAEGVRKDGTTYHLALKGKNIPYKGRAVRVVEFRDITDQKRAEGERLLLEQQFHHAQKMESLGVLAGGIAHDFNNILTIILGHCHMGQEDVVSNRRAFQQIEFAAERAAKLCHQMLTYAGKNQIGYERINLAMMLDEEVKMLQAAIKKNVTFTSDIKYDLPCISGDAGQIQQVIMNLIINAAEAIGDAEGSIAVTLTEVVYESEQGDTDTFNSIVRAGSYVCIEVKDTGCGMDEETQKRIFEPFYTTKFTGRGLGMSAIRGIVIAHKALLHLTSSIGVGTSFKVCFPVLRSSDDTEKNYAEVAVPEIVGGTILLADDENVIRTMAAELLESMGFVVMTVEHGREALERYHEHSGLVDLVLLDLTMPVMDGIATYHKLRAIAPVLPIIFCSGYSAESVQEIISTDQRSGFVNKPYKPAELRDCLAKMIGAFQSSSYTPTTDRTQV